MSRGLPEPPHQGVWIRWLDITMDGHEEWIRPEDPKGEPELVDSMGMLTHDGADTMEIVGHECRDGDRAHRTVIPKGCIVSVVYMDPRTK